MYIENKGGIYMVTISKELLNIINNYVLELSKEININKVILKKSLLSI